jgi:hypothetical protein
MGGLVVQLPLWLAAIVLVVAALIAAVWTKRVAGAWLWLTYFAVALSVSALPRLATGVYGNLAGFGLAMAMVVITAILASNVAGTIYLLWAEFASAAAAQVQKWRCCPACGNTKGFGHAQPPKQCSLCRQNPQAFLGTTHEDHESCPSCRQLLTVDAKFCPFCRCLAHPIQDREDWSEEDYWAAGGLQPR